MARAVFLDRDGTLIEDIEYLSDPSDVRLLPGVPTALRMLRDAGYDLVVVSNQSAVARGIAKPEDVKAVENCIASYLASRGASIDAWYYCFHHPEALIEEWRARCECRKPKPGMILTAAKDRCADMASSFLVGNMWSDIVAANRAGIRAILLDSTPAKTSTDPYANNEEAIPWARVSDLVEAAEMILGDMGTKKGSPSKTG